MDFYVLNSNFNVVTSKNLQFFCNLRSKIDFFPWKLRVIYNYCTSPSLLAGGFSRIQAFLHCFDHGVHEIIRFQRKNTYKMLA